MPIASRPRRKSQADARARALIELEMLLNFWGAAADGMPENLKAEACYEVAMGDVELDEGPVGIIMPYLHKEDHENRSSSCRPGELGPYSTSSPRRGRHGRGEAEAGPTARAP